MKKIANQILYNLKKEKTSFISFGVIILITALILNCAAVLLCQVDRAYDTKFEKLSTAMLNAIVPEVQNSSELEKAIDEIEKVEKIESYTAIMTEATVKDFNGADFSMNTVFYNIDDKRTLTELQLPLETVTELPPLAKELNFTIENYKYCEMPKKKEDILTIKLLTGAGEIQGIRFESKDNGETWAYDGISVE